MRRRSPPSGASPATPRDSRAAAPPTSGRGRPARRVWPWLLAAALLAAVLVLARTIEPQSGFASLRGWIDAHGALGALAFGAAFVVLVLALVPGAPLTLAAGALFGLTRGVVIVAVATTVADAVAFLAARALGRSAVERLTARYPGARAVDVAVGRAGWRIVALLRLNPAIPYSVSNYLFGATRVAFLPYLAASGIFTLPGTVAYVYLGYTGAEALAGQSRSPVEWALLVGGLAATIGGVAWITRLARRALRETEPEAAGSPPDRDSPPS